MCKKTDTIADIGTGSGAIAITLKLLQPELNVIATDLYEDALSVAKQNASHYHQNIQFLRGNALKPLIEKDIKLDGLISNPPYIGHSEIIDMESTVLNYEPHHALFAEKNGFAIYESILEDLPFVMKQGGHVVFEIGYQQGDILKEWFKIYILKRSRDFQRYQWKSANFIYYLVVKQFIRYCFYSCFVYEKHDFRSAT